MSEEQNNAPAERSASDRPAPSGDRPAPSGDRRSAGGDNRGGPRGGGRDGGRRGGPKGGGRRRFSRRKVCRFCVDKVDYIDWKDTRTLKHYISERGKIVPRRTTGTCAHHQRQLKTAVKRARQVAIVPVAAHHGRP